jgi:hypothetical protein
MTQLVTLPQVKAHLGMPAGDTTHDTELQAFIDAATPIVEYITGPVNPVTTTETLDVAGCSFVVLSKVPVISVTSAIEYLVTQPFTLTAQPPGSTTSNYGYSIDRPESGLITRRGITGMPMNFLGSTLVITYTSGLASVPADIKLAALEDIRGLWQQTQQGIRPNFRSMEEDSWMPQDMRMFPRMAAILEGRKRTQALA